MVLNMIRQGIFGEMLHAECGYLHDLRSIHFGPNPALLWRREYFKTRNCNIYPTHGLGPVGQYFDINCGDRFEYLTSMSCPSRGLQNWAQDHYASGHPFREEKFSFGDVSSTLIKTVKGRTIYLSYGTNLPRPYSRINLVQGTKGIFAGYPDRFCIEGVSSPDTWDSAEKFLEKYGHPLWKSIGRELVGKVEGSHGVMDYLEWHRLIECLHQGWPTDMNVYDAAALSAMVDLTGISVANGSQPVECPDFTRGQWNSWKPLEMKMATRS
jgi:hypothetical protein